MKKERSPLWEWLKAFSIAVVLAIVIREFIITNYVVHGESMMPTIQDGNRLIINKIGYEVSEPDRFDLVVFHANENEDYIKRVIGLPGDTLEYKDDQLYINGKKMKEPYLTHFKSEVFNGNLTENFKLEDKTEKAVVPEGYLFLMGDNRRHSYDSRHIGLVPIDQVVGEVNLRYWPIEEFDFTFKK
ncbi:signal peptidase I [Alkalihalobacillus sp. CinArs1]|uniref:signal peptidase I n=1 Tax=Alkalihalobacillus sp. CinArs1 TaxID=2995314 RepID=UPI0022DDC60E|nr:signal peptidase I [Alkalihalobacillus sp. CinArs1]